MMSMLPQNSRLKAQNVTSITLDLEKAESATLHLEELKTINTHCGYLDSQNELLH